jgi:hypothetical protein
VKRKRLVDRISRLKKKKRKISNPEYIVPKSKKGRMPSVASGLVERPFTLTALYLVFVATLSE